MTALIVVDHPEEWPHTFAAAEVISADAYLRDERFSGMRQARVYNLCDSSPTCSWGRPTSPSSSR
jgi:hypothetical protein